MAYTKALSIKLKGRYIDVVNAYQQVSFILTTLKDAREDVDSVHTRMYERALQTASAINVEDSLPRTTSRQQHRSNTTELTTSDYYKRVITIPALDHLIAEVDARFDQDSSAVVCQIAHLLLSALAETDKAHTTLDIADLSSKCYDDLPAPESLDTELHCWSAKWCRGSEDAAALDTPAKVIQNIDQDFFPNLYVLLQIACTLAVTSAECERSISRLRCLKTYLRSTMSEDRLNGLALLYAHRDIPCNADFVVQEFAQRNPRRISIQQLYSLYTQPTLERAI